MRKQDEFQLGDRVFYYREGWGKITNIDKCQISIFPITVTFDNGDESTFTKEGLYDTTHPHASLSYEEYDFVHGGFSQSRPRPKLKAGTIIYVREKTSGNWLMLPFVRWEYDGTAVVFLSQKEEGLQARFSEWSLTNPLEGDKDE